MRSARRWAAPSRSASKPLSTPSTSGWRRATAKGPQENRRLVRLADAWDKVNQAARDADTYNLDRKPLVFAVFGWLAEAERR